MNRVRWPPRAAHYSLSSSVKKVGGEKGQLELFVDCANPVEDGIMKVSEFEAFLNSRIKANNKTNNLGKEIVVSREKNKILITSNIAFSKRESRIALRIDPDFELPPFSFHVSEVSHQEVVSTTKDAFELVYHKVPNEDEGEEEEANE
ncbi:60S ribosomal protein L22-like [Galendromus occidentalis]|uniref:Large ribosomal subunit protein eL22 n=1 Tax=Galendromus occidentalis TaxID=34638 RepID=A0AAJ7L4M9_9ACAR|nr:60S ribosomal protein L22-like [Galendromus occidentalis]